MSASGYSNTTVIMATATNDISAATTTRTAPIGMSFQVNEIIFIVTTATTGASGSIITVNREIKTGVTTSQIAIGTFTIVTALAVGDVVRTRVNNIADTDFAIGEGANFVSDGGGDAGVGWFGLVGNFYDEPPLPAASFTSAAKPRSGAGNIVYAAFTQT